MRVPFRRVNCGVVPSGYVSAANEQLRSVHCNHQSEQRRVRFAFVLSAFAVSALVPTNFSHTLPSPFDTSQRELLMFDFGVFSPPLKEARSTQARTFDRLETEGGKFQSITSLGADKLANFCSWRREAALKGKFTLCNY
jgi:hypothetical protein